MRKLTDLAGIWLSMPGPFASIRRISVRVMIVVMGVAPVVMLQALEGSSASAKGEVQQVLRTQQEAWNRHDLEGFMAGYWKAPQLTFFANAQESRGWQAAMDRYQKAYAGPGHEMGKLDFSGLRIEILGREAAFVRGEWKLTMSDGKTPHGLFTLVFRKFGDGWKIVHDHTSSAE